MHVPPPGALGPYQAIVVAWVVGEEEEEDGVDWGEDGFSLRG